MIRAICAFVCLLVASVSPASAQSEADRTFRRGLSLLHEFEYEDANEAFRQAQSLDPAFCMGYWGEAMTYHQALWRHENVGAARAALARLGRTPADRRARCRNVKDAELIAAVDALFGAGDASSRRRAYAEAMQRAHEHFRDDPDIAALYALSLLATAARGLIGSADAHEGHSEGLAGSETQTRVAAILDEVLKSHPDHRGALHYLLHDYDDPQHAQFALPAARRYSAIAEASHARHMSSHIFLQLGLWSDAARSDRAAFDASTAWVREKNLGAALRNYHALAWLQYELLQLGRYHDADETIRELEPVVAAGGNLTLLSDLSSMRARFVVESQRWERMAGARNFGNVNDLFAIGMSAARSGNVSAAEIALRSLDARAQAKEEGDFRPAIEIMANELRGLIDLASGRRQQALTVLESAARAELELPAPFGLPAPIKPAPELLGEVLLETGRPADAMEWFEHALRRNANRSRSMIGLARSSAAAGHADAARARYREALANFEHADSDLPELAELHAGLEAKPAAPTSTQPAVAAAFVLAAASLGVVAVMRWRRRAKERPAPRGRAGPKSANRKRNQKR